jgi:hypothetical protein
MPTISITSMKATAMPIQVPGAVRNISQPRNSH